MERGLLHDRDRLRGLAAGRGDQPRRPARPRPLAREATAHAATGVPGRQRDVRRPDPGRGGLPAPAPGPVRSPGTGRRSLQRGAVGLVHAATAHGLRAHRAPLRPRPGRLGGLPERRRRAAEQPGPPPRLAGVGSPQLGAGARAPGRPGARDRAGRGAVRAAAAGPRARGLGPLLRRGAGLARGGPGRRRLVRRDGAALPFPGPARRAPRPRPAGDRGLLPTRGATPSSTCCPTCGSSVPRASWTTTTSARRARAAWQLSCTRAAGCSTRRRGPRWPRGWPRDRRALEPWPAGARHLRATPRPRRARPPPGAWDGTRWPARPSGRPCEQRWATPTPVCAPRPRSPSDGAPTRARSLRCWPC